MAQSTWALTKTPKYGRGQRAARNKRLGVGIEYTRQITKSATLRIVKGLWSWEVWFEIDHTFWMDRINLGICLDSWNNLAKRKATKLLKEYIYKLQIIGEAL